MNKGQRNKSKVQRVGLVFGDWLTGYTVLLIRGSIYRDGRVI